MGESSKQIHIFYHFETILLFMKRLLIAISFISFLSICCLALDHIILRNGLELDVKLHHITNDYVVFNPNVSKKDTRESIPTQDVYMVYIEKQGNIYLTEDGKRITGESDRVDPKKYDVIYLVSGGEIGAKSISLTENEVQYLPLKKNNKQKKGGILGSLLGGSEDHEIQTLQNQEVFMIRYKSGMTDVITSIDKIENPIEEVEEDEPQRSQYVVLFHAVTRGQNLKSIAEQYGVTVQQIIDWNDLPTKSKPTAPLTVGMQLMIYQPKQN